MKGGMKKELVNLANSTIYEDTSLFTTGEISSGLNRDIRSVQVASFEEDSIGQSVSKRILFNELKKFTETLNNLYKENVSEWYFSKKNYFQFLRYEASTQGKYEYHSDHSGEYPRTLTVLIGMNSSNEYEGGELFVQNEEKGVKLDLGDVIAFPSNFMYPHKVAKVTSGERKVLVIWTM
jgi:predicted 2-oxoglutarate/Fe(II)-dependent dioxygenase YbiX